MDAGGGNRPGRGRRPREIEGRPADGSQPIGRDRRLFCLSPCRAGRHRSWGKGNTMLGEPYWAEAHTAASPSGTRAVFASDWGNGSTVDTYVLELPSYKP
jgi:hypothetical protein